MAPPSEQLRVQHVCLADGGRKLDRHGIDTALALPNTLNELQGFDYHCTRKEMIVNVYVHT